MVVIFKATGYHSSQTNLKESELFKPMNVLRNNGTPGKKN